MMKTIARCFTKPFSLLQFSAMYWVSKVKIQNFHLILQNITPCPLFFNTLGLAKTL